MKKIIAIFVFIAITGATVWFFSRDNGETGTSYRFVEVEQGDLEAVVSSTGTLEAVKTVQVGTQVSGIISQLFVDFNDTVRKGQVVARLDTTLLASAVRDAEISLERNIAQFQQAERDFERINNLFEKQFVTEVEYNTAKYNLDVAKANTKSAQISLDRARQNLSYATIYAPISGTVIERNVEVGQTVAASLSAPQLFLIANDLSRLQILASVDESDIGRIEEGQEVRFTVQAYPEDTFIGTVRQVRLQSSMQENVVNYTVVVDVNNDDGRLLPGMTATLDFLIETASDVFKVANAALRFRPTEDMVAEMRARRQQARENRPDSLRERFGGRRDSTRQGNRGNGQGGFGGGDQGSFGPGGGQGGFGGFGGRQGRSGMTMLWYVDETGNLAIAPVRTGITDGESTEIMGRTIEPGMQVIAGVSQGETPSASTNPFQSQQQGGRRRPGGF